MKMEKNTIWNEAAKAGLVFGGFSSLCLSLKELAGLSGSNILIQFTAFVLWAVEFVGCIWLMKRYLVMMRDRFGADIADCRSFGKRTALLSGLILASVQTVFILKMPPEALNEAIATASASLGASARDQMDAALDSLPAVTFLAQWFYCFIYGTILSSILTRYVIAEEIIGGTDKGDGEDNSDEDD